MGIGNRMKKDIFDIEMELVGREVYSDRLFLGHFAPTNGEQVVPICLPGQFVEIQVKNCDGVMLRRPISVYAATERTLDLLIQNAGKGTEVLCNAPVGSRFKLNIGPDLHIGVILIIYILNVAAVYDNGALYLGCLVLRGVLRPDA